MIGIIGGLGWTSTEVYYRKMNEHSVRLRGLGRNLPCVVYSFELLPILEYEYLSDWRAIAAELDRAASALKTIGAELLVVACNTVHRAVALSSTLDCSNFLPIHQALAHEVAGRFGTVGLIATANTVRDGLYEQALAEVGCSLVTPELNALLRLDREILGTLVHGEVTQLMSSQVAAIANNLVERGAEAILLGCTELGLVPFEPTHIPVLDSAEIHAEHAVRVYLERQDAADGKSTSR